MVVTSGRNPFKLANPNQRIPELPSPFIKKGDHSAERICLPAVAGSDILSTQPGPCFITPSPDSPTQIWISDWIDSTGEPMDYQKEFYPTTDSQGTTWKARPSVTCSSDAMRQFADDANSVNYSSTGQEGFDFQSSSSDTGNSSFQYLDTNNSSILRQPVDDTSVSGSTFSGQGFDHESEPQSYYHQVPGMMSNTQIQSSDAGAIYQYSNPTLGLESGYTLDSMDESAPSDGSNDSSPRLEEYLDVHSHLYDNDKMDLFYTMPEPSAFASNQFTNVDLLEQSNSISPTLVDATWNGNMTTSIDDDIQGQFNLVATGPTHANGDFQTVSGSTLETSDRNVSASATRSVPLAPRPPVSSSRPDATRKSDEPRKSDSKSKKVQSDCQPRSHEYYSARPGKDGYYHCPWKVKEKCPHEPTKQKCTYDKHVDAHLKPYRCKKKECSKLTFSSNAVLGRHERETHGMHGHGENPYRCTVPDCRRSQPDQGFPRRWNARDHMKRVHNLVVHPDADDDGLGPVPEESLSHSMEPTTRKRTGSRNAIPMKKTASSQSKRSTRSNPEERRATTVGAGHPAMPTQRRQSYPAQTVSIVPGYPYYSHSPSMDTGVCQFSGFGQSYQTEGVDQFSVNY